MVYQKPDTRSLISLSMQDLLSRKSFEKITISDIMSGCEMRREMFYYYFPDKFELISWMFENEACERFISDFEGPGTHDQLIQRCIDWLAFFPEHDFIRLLLADTVTAEVRKIMIAGLSSILEGHVCFSRKTDELSRLEEQCVLGYATSIVDFSSRWIKSGYEAPIEEVGRVIAELVPTGIIDVYRSDISFS